MGERGKKKKKKRIGAENSKLIQNINKNSN